MFERVGDGMIEPRGVTSRVPSCPRCGEKHYTYMMASGLPLKIEKIRCAQCGAGCTALLGLHLSTSQWANWIA
jgi:ribosomal protein S27AE